MKLTFPTTDAQLMHVASRSESHRHDKAQGDFRRAFTYFAVESEPRPSQLRPELRGLAAFELTAPSPGKWDVCKGPEDLGRFLIDESKRRAPYRATVARAGRTTTMRRVDNHPLAIMTVSLHPAANDCIAAKIRRDGLRAGQASLNQIVCRFVPAAERAVAGRRYVIAAAAHTDTDDLHVDLVLARNNGEPGGRLGGGLSTVGPWTVGARRQMIVGAKIGTEKLRMVTQNLNRFWDKYGASAVALDVRLADAMDAAATEVLGEELKEFKQSWVLWIPEAEKGHLLAALREIDSAREKCLKSLGAEAREAYFRELDNTGQGPAIDPVSGAQRGAAVVRLPKPAQAVVIIHTPVTTTMPLAPAPAFCPSYEPLV